MKRAVLSGALLVAGLLLARRSSPQAAVDVEVTALTKTAPRVTRFTGVDPRPLAGKPMVVRVPST